MFCENECRMLHATQAAIARNRLDHIIPRSYLKGFSNATGKVAVFECVTKRWFEANPANIGAERAYYDYSADSAPDQTADDAFKRLEEGFPPIRTELIAGGFAGWRARLPFLLEYAQMLRARSRLFRTQFVENARGSIRGVVDAVVTKDDENIPTGLSVRPYVPANEPKTEEQLRNLSITEMRREIAKGAALFGNLHWCVRTTQDMGNPVITADQPVIVLGSAGLSEETLTRDPDTWIIFPLCREACLIGNCERMETDTEPFEPSGLQWLRGQFFRADAGFIYSPAHVDSTPSQTS
jgi:hypothetical protein